MRLSRLFHVKKSRKYPIKRDREGLSLRARCFELFEQRKRPAAASRALGWYPGLHGIQRHFSTDYHARYIRRASPERRLPLPECCDTGKRGRRESAGNGLVSWRRIQHGLRQRQDME